MGFGRDKSLLGQGFLRKLRKENKVLRQEREVLRKATAFFAREDGIR